MWSENLITDVNKALNNIDDHITKAIGGLKVSMSIIEAMDGIVMKLDATHKLADRNENKLTN